MRRSFGPGMGGGGGGGGMIKTVHRAVRAGIGGGSSGEQPYSHSNITTTRSSTTTNNRNINQPINNTTLFVSSNNNNNNNPASPFYVPVAAPPNWVYQADEEFDNWEYIDGSDSESVYGVYDDIDVFGSVPSKDEVHHAVTSLQEVLEPVYFGRLINDLRSHGTEDNGVEKILGPAGFYKSGSESDWIEPSMQLCNSISALQVPSSDTVYDAFHLLQTEPSVQRMVISLSSDKAVWDAVMNNEVVRELRESVNEDKSITEVSGNSVDNSNPVIQVLSWIFANTKDKVIEIVEKITKIVNELVHPVNKDDKSMNAGLNSFAENLRSSFFLSIMVLLIVVVSRSRK